MSFVQLGAPPGGPEPRRNRGERSRRPRETGKTAPRARRRSAPEKKAGPPTDPRARGIPRTTPRRCEDKPQAAVWCFDTSKGPCFARLLLKNAARRNSSRSLARLRAEFAIDRQENCGSAGRKCPHTASKPLRIHKVFSAGFSCLWHFCSGRTALASDSLGFSRDFCSFGRRRAVARQGEKGKAPKG